MTRNLFGGTTSDVAEDIDGRRVPGAVGTVWDGPSYGARQITDLTDADGAPIIQPTSAASSRPSTARPTTASAYGSISGWAGWPWSP
ncbi:hypothetical protein GCM10010315_36660 [Streptomyces luteosporeus]|uniref:Uncharacterized protein n=1 Tax=Streptomyces luteosporeus TaxID=173856 RepID=A0ABN3TU87_9ACTN